MKLTNIENYNDIDLKIKPSGELNDESIEGISLISRSSKKGYARQNNLLPGTWISIYFNTNVPEVITGNITNLEEDMIEIKTYPDNETIYIDFAYKGIPLDLPIEEIIIRDDPQSAPDDEAKPVELSDPNATEAANVAFEEQPMPSNFTLSETLEIDNNEIEFGNELDAITQLVEVPDDEKRYGIETQLNDLLDELLSSVPINKRTNTVLKNIHTMVERFKQLRSEYSEMDEKYSSVKKVLKGSEHKPLVKSLNELDTSLPWLVPIIKNKKKVYNANLDEVDEYSDIINMTLAESRISEHDITQLYKNNEVPDGQNKYTYLIQQLNSYLTPFTLPAYPDNQIITKPVKTNMLGFMDNLDDFYSSAITDESIHRTRFDSQVYETGLYKLGINEQKSMAITFKEQITPSDQMNIKSFLSLPVQAIIYSKLYLPETDILEQSNLNLVNFNHWQLLNKFTNVVNSDEGIINSEKPMESEEEFNSFFQQIRELVPKPFTDSQDDYNKFLDSIVPNVRNLFNAMKPIIKNQFTFIDVVKVLEPFLVYTNDITFKSYEDMMRYVYQNINDYKKDFVSASKKMSSIRFVNYKITVAVASLTTILSKIRDIEVNVNTAYNITNSQGTKTTNMTDSEILRKILNADSCRLFANSIALCNQDLMSTINLDNELKTIQEQLLEQTEVNASNKPEVCKRVLVKKYNDLSELEADNDKTIYVDDKYDKIPYDILKEYKTEIDNMSIEDFTSFLTDKLQEVNGLDAKEAKFTASAMINGKQPVRNGEYALLDFVGQAQGEEEEDMGDVNASAIYVRKDNKWNLENSKLQLNDDESTFCNVNEECIYTKDTCESTLSLSDNIQNKNLQAMLNEFESRSDITTQDFVATLNSLYMYNLEMISVREQLQNERIFKYLKLHHNIGLTAQDVDVVKSPYSDVFDSIVGQADFTKRQTDIYKFCINFTHPGDELHNDPYWRYCNKTNIKLVPSFFYDLAYTFQINGDYSKVLADICRERGTISDDGDAWVDKHSGRFIKKIEFNDDEGYDESGFKSVSREVMEKDMGETIVQAAVNKQPVKTLTPENRVIVNIVSALTGYMGITIDNQREFILRYVNTIAQQGIPSEEAYERKSEKMLREKGKALPPYKDMKNSTLIIITLSVMLIAIQVNIPSVKTKKTFPGCVRSFSGYPAAGSQEDMTGITYIACVANKIKGGSEPWTALKKMSMSGIITRMKDILGRYLLSNREIEDLIKAKAEYMKVNKDDEIPIEHDISKWSTFLPPLKPFHLVNVKNVTKEFLASTMDSIRKGNKDQLERINEIESKIFYFS